MENPIANLFTWYGTARRPKRIRSERKLHGIQHRTVVFPSAHPDGVPLSGWLVPPEHGEPRGVVILCHGHAGSRLCMLPKAVALRRHHFTTLLFDFRAHGMSGGEYCTLGDRETADVLGAVEFLRQHETTAGLPISILGESMGGAAAILAAASEPAITAVVTEAAFASLDVVVDRRLRSFLGPMAAPVMKSCRLMSAERLDLQFPNVAPADVVAKLSPRPFLLIQDGLDIVCPSRESERLFEAALQPKERWIIPFAPHTFGYQASPREFERRVVGFLSDAVGRGS